MDAFVGGEGGIDPGLLMDESSSSSSSGSASASQRSNSVETLQRMEQRTNTNAAHERNTNAQEDVSRNTVMIHVRGARPRRPSKRKMDALGLDEDGYPVSVVKVVKKPKIASFATSTPATTSAPRTTTSAPKTTSISPVPEKKKRSRARPVHWPTYEGGPYYCHQCRGSSRRLYMSCSKCGVKYCVKCFVSWYVPFYIVVWFVADGNGYEGMIPRFASKGNSMMREGVFDVKARVDVINVRRGWGWSINR